MFYSLFQLHYGIFLDGYTFSLLLDSYLKKKDYKGKFFGQVFFYCGVVNGCVCVCVGVGVCVLETLSNRGTY